MHYEGNPLPLFSLEGNPADRQSQGKTSEGAGIATQRRTSMVHNLALDRGGFTSTRKIRRSFPLEQAQEGRLPRRRLTSLSGTCPEVSGGNLDRGLGKTSQGRRG